jgi:hypothetical protein
MAKVVTRLSHAEQLARTGHREEARDALLALVADSEADADVNAIADYVLSLFSRWGLQSSFAVPNRPYNHRRPGDSKHRPWQGGW